MASRLSWFKFNPSDWLSDDRVQAMGWAMQGAFIHLLSRMWKRAEGGGKPVIPNDDKYLCQVLGATPDEMAQIRAQLIVGPLAVFSAENGELSNKRLSIELLEARRQYEGMAQGGSKLVKTKKKPRSLKRLDLESGSGSAKFETFWAAYPIHKARADAESVWQKVVLEASLADLIIADVQKRKVSDSEWVAGYAPRAGKYLRGKLWTDDIKPLSTPNPIRPDTRNSRAPAAQDGPSRPTPKSVREVIPWAFEKG